MNVVTTRCSGAIALRRVVVLCLAILIGAATPALADNERPHVDGGTAVQRGAYLVAIAGCNDCHTAGWMEHPGEIPTAQRLTGNPVGWHGPWGTSFAANLRLVVARMSADQWLKHLATFHPLPPMPAYNVQSMSKPDQLAIYAYIKSLGPAGQPAPTALPPGALPLPPYFTLVLPPKEK